MKVTCNSCGKKYNYDKYDGLCPKCGSFYTMPHKTSAIEEAYRLYKPQVKSHSYKGASQEYVKKRRRITTYILILLILILPCTILPLAKLFCKRSYEQACLKEKVVPETIEMNKPFTYVKNNNTYGEGTTEYPITITGVYIEDNPDFRVPAKYDLIYVTYQITLPADTANYYRDGNFLPDILYLSPYLLTKSGEYLRTVSTYDICNVYGYDYEIQETMGINNSFDYQKGRFYFLVKENDVAALYLVTDKEISQNDSYITNIKSYILNDLEVTQ